MNRPHKADVEALKRRAVLDAADRFEAEPELWTRFAFSRESNGKRVGAFDEEAASFCAAGMVRRCALDLTDGRRELAETAGWAAILDAGNVVRWWGSKTTLMDWNDEPNRTVEDVIILLRKVYEEAI